MQVGCLRSIRRCRSRYRVTVQLRFGDQLIDERTIAKSETHLFRAVIGSDIEEISLSIESAEEIPSLWGHLRLNVVQRVPFATKP